MSTRDQRPVLCLAITPALQRTLFFGALRPGEVNRARIVRVSPSGKGVNVAAVFARLGAPPRLVGFRGGPGGVQIEEEVAALGIDARWVVTAAPTRNCHTLIEAESGRVTELVEEATPPTDADWRQFLELMHQALPGCGWLAISGALPPGAAPERLAEFVRQAHAAGASVCVDSQGEPFRLMLAERPALVKINTDELAVICGYDVQAPAERWKAIHGLRERGAGSVFVTDGPGAAYLSGSGGDWTLTPPAIKALNPIGSGDAVTAGLLFGLQRGDTLLNAATFALACGTAHAHTEIPGLVDASAAAALRNRVRVSKA